MFKKNSLLRALMVSGLTTGLIACGGGDGDSSGGGLPPADSYVAGMFKDAEIDGVSYLAGAGSATVGQGGQACAGETHYFETQDGRVRVYGSTAFSETDFEVVATMIHSRVDSVLAKFGMNWQEFVDQRPYFTADQLADFVRLYHPDYEQRFQPVEVEGDGSDPVVDTIDPTLTTSAVIASSDDDRYSEDAASWAQWNALSVDEQMAFAEALVDFFSQAETRDYKLPRTALVACLSPGMSGSMFGEGSQVGISVPPNTSTYHSKVGEIFTHEVIHFVQLNIASVGTDNPFMLMPRWFTEGQAVYLAGQSLASVDHHHQINAAEITSWDAEMETGEDARFLYGHYGLAYQYVHENNGVEAVVNMMTSMKTNTDTPHLWRPYTPFDPANPEANDKAPGLAFGTAFAQHINDHTGVDLEVERYRTTYHDLMNGWGAQR